MVWIRRISAPQDLVWKTISTKAGLARWWVVPPSSFELKKGDEEFAQSAPVRSELQDFYTGYLRDVYRWHRIVQRTDPE